MGGTTSRLRQRVRLTHFLPREQALRRCVNESWSRLGVLIAPRDPLPGPLPCGTSPALFLSWDNLCPFTQRLTTAFSTQAHGHTCRCRCRGRGGILATPTGFLVVLSVI